ncbi:hypothetical protein FH972_021403 [Carpinus fangiana]|uniref:hexokinase n=1 Tax=Carpinus fangiana TaxID=176857 RepID=A0A5N6KPT4_9ROSI|nr:hypothetical protein FH972_021403 [Carpinus fangiana]
MQSSITSWLNRRPKPDPDAAECVLPRPRNATSVLLSERPVKATILPEHQEKSNNLQFRPPFGPSQPLPGSAKIEPCTALNVDGFKRLNAVLLPIPYPNTFYDEILNDDVTNTITRLAVWHDEPVRRNKPGEVASTTKAPKVVAGIRCRLLQSPAGSEQPHGQPVLYISTIGTLAPFRGHGLAAHLLAHVARTGVERYGARTIMGHVWEANEEGMAWYKSRGFRVTRREEALVVQIVLQRQEILHKSSEIHHLQRTNVELEGRDLTYEWVSQIMYLEALQLTSREEAGLEKPGTTMQQIPTYVTAVPNGTEKGLYMAVDLGGTNFRVCSVQLHGNTTFSLTHSKVAVPHELMVAKTSKELFSFLAKQIESFLKLHHGDHYATHLEKRGTGDSAQDTEIFSLGFTFSFPVNQVGINKSTLIRWTKGFDIADTIGKDVCTLLQQEIDALGLPVKVVALVNDTVGTLMARSYTSPGKTGTLLGAIFGTGTNGAYVERLENVSKLRTSKEVGDYDKSTGEMIVNTEWGSFDNTMKVLPTTPYDDALDVESNNPGIQMFEKRISGMFLGEIVRRALLTLFQDGKSGIFTDADSKANDLHSTTNVDSDSALFARWGLDTSFLSTASGDSSPGLRLTRQALAKDLSINAASIEDAEAVKVISTAVGKRAARLSAVAIGAIVVASGKLEKSTGNEEDDVIDVGVDGSLVEFYPHFESYIREALRDISQIGATGEKRIRIGIAKDGSGVGAALIALVADRMGTKAPTQESSGGSRSS